MILAIEGIWGTIASIIVVAGVLGSIIFINYAAGKKDIIKNTLKRHNYRRDTL
ncbi:hypothetical protein [Mucilaginibacter myungsuensis]|uniref:Uncharacterized protein n=1 Tax=Mucilaginibacter myungsuensis TaxID=649104 RepID=A0A929PW51_9SPHI|nr:hypothetical protein [Mucilaginibacter myungsuensis]MBE9660995.1 hypothetical protein [Mucilaginibacter myungsuensis]MDN3601041.1 hypothetical protein [Mucilaginibacter myungsuensis]